MSLLNLKHSKIASTTHFGTYDKTGIYQNPERVVADVIKIN